MFRNFDSKSKCAVSYSDFAYGIEELGLCLDRDLLIQMFAYLDRDHDGYLKYSDFVSMFQEASSGFITTGAF